MVRHLITKGYAARRVLSRDFAASLQACFCASVWNIICLFLRSFWLKSTGLVCVVLLVFNEIYNSLNDALLCTSSGPRSSLFVWSYLLSFWTEMRQGLSSSSSAPSSHNIKWYTIVILIWHTTVIIIFPVDRHHNCRTVNLQVFWYFYLPYQGLFWLLAFVHPPYCDEAKEEMSPLWFACRSKCHGTCYT